MCLVVSLAWRVFRNARRVTNTTHASSTLCCPLTPDHTQSSQAPFHVKFVCKMEWKCILTTLRRWINLKLLEIQVWATYLLSIREDSTLGTGRGINSPQTLRWPCRGSESEGAWLWPAEGTWASSVFKSPPPRSPPMLTGPVHLAHDHEDPAYGLWGRNVWVQVLTQSNTSSVTLDNLFTFSVTQFPHL